MIVNSLSIHPSVIRVCPICLLWACFSLDYLRLFPCLCCVSVFISVLFLFIFHFVPSLSIFFLFLVYMFSSYFPFSLVFRISIIFYIMLILSWFTICSWSMCKLHDLNIFFPWLVSDSHFQPIHYQNFIASTWVC